MSGYIIAIDFDSTINNMLDVWVETLNDRYKLSVKVEDITDWDMKIAYPELTNDQIYEVLSERDYWEKVQLVEGAREAIERWQKEGHRVYIVTSTKYTNAKDKFDACLLKLLPTITYKDIIITYHKNLIVCDFMIDDYHKNLELCKGYAILIDKPYNKDFIADGFYSYRAQDFNDAVALIDDIWENKTI